MSEPEVIALFALVGVLFTAVIGVLGTVLTLRQNAQTALLTDARADLAATRAELAATKTEVERNEGRIAALERRDHALVRYVRRLRKHINDELGPPPPDWPTELAADLDSSDDD